MPHDAAPAPERPASAWIFLATAVLSTGWLAFAKANDFLVYWAAGRDLRVAGWDAVYQISTLTPFKYHPVFALLLVPLGALPVAVAKVVWAILNGLAIFDLQRRWQRHWRLDAVAIGIGFLGVAHALSWQLRFGNVTFIMLWLWTVAVTAAGPWRQALSYGVLIALKPFWLILLGPWILARRWPIVARVAMALVVLSLLPGLLGPDSLVAGYDRWLATFADPAHAHNFPKNDNQTWYALLTRHQGALGASLMPLWVAGSAVVGGLWLWSWRDRLRAGAAATADWAVELTVLPVMLFAAPLSWIHHQILLWPLLALGWRRARADRRAKVIWAVTWLLLNGTGQLVLGRSGFVTVAQWGVPILAFVVLAWWGRRLVEPTTQ